MSKRKDKGKHNFSYVVRQLYPHKTLCEIIENDDTDDIRKYINKHTVNKYAVDGDINTSPLMIAVKKQNYNIIKLLVNSGANPLPKVQYKYGSKYDFSIFEEAIKQNLVNILEFLCSNCGNLDGDGYQSLVGLSLSDASLESFKFLYSRFGYRAYNYYGHCYINCALIQAINTSNIKIVEYLINCGANINGRSGNETPLSCCLLKEKPNFECADLLINYGADINFQHTYSTSYWERPIECCHIIDKVTKNFETIKYLVKNGAIVTFQTITNILNNFEFDSMNVAMYLLDINKKKICSNVNFNMYEKDKNGNNILFSFVSKSGKYNLRDFSTFISFCVDLGISIKDKPKNGSNLLLALFEKTSYLHTTYLTEKMDFLVECGIDINEPDNNGVNVFMKLILSSAPMNFLKFFIERGVNLNQEDAYGNTILTYSILARNPDMVRYLLKNGIQLDNRSAGVIIENSYKILANLFKLKTLQEYFDDEDYANIFKYTSKVKTTNILSDEICALCMDEANMKTECGHHYCQHCYVFFYMIKKNAKKCCYCKKDVGNMVYLQEDNKS